MYCQCYYYISYFIDADMYHFNTWVINIVVMKAVYIQNKGWHQLDHDSAL